MEKLASIESDEIVIRVPIAALPVAAPYAWDRHYGQHDISIVNVNQFAKEVLLELLREEENGDTLIHKMLDRACVNAAENGAEGLSP